MLEECIKVTGNHDNKKPNFVITDTKLYVAVVTLSVQNNAKLLQHLKTGFKGTVNWNKYQSESTLLTRNRYLNKFSGRKCAFCFIIWKSWTWNKLQAIFYFDCRNRKLQFYDWWKNVSDQPVKDDLITYDNMRKISTGQRDDYIAGCLLDYN